MLKRPMCKLQSRIRHNMYAKLVAESWNRIMEQEDKKTKALDVSRPFSLQPQAQHPFNVNS